MLKKNYRVSAIFLSVIMLLLSACGGPSITNFIAPHATTTGMTIPDNGKRLFVTTNSSLYAIRDVDGKIMWQTSNFPPQNIWLIGNTIYLAYNKSGNGLAAINAQTGHIEWATPFDNNVSSVQSDGTYTFVSEGQLVYAFDIHGNLLWKNDFTGTNNNINPQNNNANSTINLYYNQNILYVGDQDVYAMSTVNKGNKVWESDTINTVNAMTQINGTLVVQSKDMIEGIDTNGKTIWSYPIQGGTYTSSKNMVYADYTSNLPPDSTQQQTEGIEMIQTDSTNPPGKLSPCQNLKVTNSDMTHLVSFNENVAYVENQGAMVDQIEAIQLPSCQIQWTTPVAPPNTSIGRTESGDAIASIQATSQEIYALTTTGKLYAFNPPDGVQFWNADTKGAELFSANDSGFFGKNNNNIISFDPLTGKQLWNVSLDNSPQDAQYN